MPSASEPRAQGSVWVVVREFEWGGEYGHSVIGVAASEDAAQRIEESHKPLRGSGRTVGIDWHEWEITA